MFPKRHAISRAYFFLNQAEKCTFAERDAFEAYLEATIVFARAAIHRLKSRYKAHPAWKAWFESLRTDPAVAFFRSYRDFILKEAPPKVGQIIKFEPVSRAAEHYYFEDPTIPATETLRRYLDSLADIVAKAETDFSK